MMYIKMVSEEALVGLVTLLLLTTTTVSGASRQLIVGGHDADPDRFPYHVRLDYEGEFGCGATLVRRDMLLTAAHCVFEDEIPIMLATVGAVDPFSADNTRPVTQVWRHPAYHDNSDINDFALLKIDPPVSESIPTLGLNSDRAQPRVGDSVTAIGLGATSEGGEDANVLQQVELKVVPDEKCDDEYAGDLHRKSMLCAADPNQDACEGDSGGGLIVLGETPADDVQVGVVSFGDECAHESIPGVYADVSYVYSWIESTLCEHSMDPPPGCKNATWTYIIGEDEECHDYPGAFYVNWWHQFQRCEWLSGRIDLFCYKDNEAWTQCPFTCHSCTYEEDDELFDSEEEEGSEEEGSEDEDIHNESSSPLAMGMLFAISFAYCCTICVWSCHRVRRANKEEKSQEEKAPIMVAPSSDATAEPVEAPAPLSRDKSEEDIVEVPPANVTIF